MGIHFSGSLEFERAFLASRKSPFAKYKAEAFDQGMSRLPQHVKMQILGYKELRHLTASLPVDYIKKNDGYVETDPWGTLKLKSSDLHPELSMEVQKDLFLFFSGERDAAEGSPEELRSKERLRDPNYFNNILHHGREDRKKLILTRLVKAWPFLPTRASRVAQIRDFGPDRPLFNLCSRVNNDEELRGLLRLMISSFSEIHRTDTGEGVSSEEIELMAKREDLTLSSALAIALHPETNNESLLQLSRRFQK